jgi:FAD/FMN-containing dehydrogenase/Fe-S oxidoreductase
MDSAFLELQSRIKGELYHGTGVKSLATRKVYATDASVYQELPVAVCLPKTIDDIKQLIAFAHQQKLTLVPRAAGTSLAGQVVSGGIIVDISRHFTSVLEINAQERWVRVEPGVIRDDLNSILKQYGLMFGPETSTSSRAMIGGMIGNNSCGLHSIIWGDTRSNLLEVKGLLSDNSEVHFKEINSFDDRSQNSGATLEDKIYNGIQALLAKPENQRAIADGFPKASISRRNSGYALDSLLQMIAKPGAFAFNMCSLVAGSEGTLCFVTEAKLKLLPLPPSAKGVVAVHCNSIREALQVNIEALKHSCSASELVDDVILEYTKGNIEQLKNRFFVEGDPKAILMVEFMSDSVDALMEKKNVFTSAISRMQLGYAMPLLVGADADKAWELRKAGLGLLRNEPGDIQPVNLIEDCAVDVQDLESYVAEVEILLNAKGIKYSMYAHAGAGELHIEPMINLKTKEGRTLFKTVLQETATLVKKYRGSLSGEHGDGRLRGEFIPYVMGEHNYSLFKEVKALFDPENIFNKGKIVDTPSMNSFLRYDEQVAHIQSPTVFSFTEEESILRLAEKCSGSGDCRKTHISGGTMCPSYMITRNERDTTRARANILRQFYASAKAPDKAAYEEVKDILDLCISCKGCKAECPSSVDVGKMKAEFTQQYYEKYGVPRRAKLIGNFTVMMKLASSFATMYNLVAGQQALRSLTNKIVGFHPARSLPEVHAQPLRTWFAKHPPKIKGQPKGVINFYCDEFTNYNDVEGGRKAIALLAALGYQVIIPQHTESGRSLLSKGLLKEAKKRAEKNIRLLQECVTDETPLIGFEPSAILSFRDEYPQLVDEADREGARKLAANCFLFEEWIVREVARGNITPESFSQQSRTVIVHGHCHQKALSSTSIIAQCLSLPVNYDVRILATGCCGMAGSFGYEREHYEVSMGIGELVLFPAVRSAGDAIIAASGTSCRHQIKDGTGRKAQHTAEILFDALG